MKEKLRAIMILNEVTVECARSLSADKFLPIQERLNEVKDILIEEMYPTTPEATIDYQIQWGQTTNS